jgi:RNA polymerase sigma-70 factor (ECF subfamily)
MIDDLSLLRALQAGDPAALERLFNAYADRLYRLALGLLGDEAEADDIVQGAFLKVITRLDAFEGRSNLGTWLYRVAYNASLDLLRSRRETFLPEEDGSEEGDAPAIMPSVLVEWSSPEALLADAEARRNLDEAIHTLPESLRSVFLLRDVEQLSTLEVAEVMGISESLVKVRLHRARLTLRERLAVYFAERIPKEG